MIRHLLFRFGLVLALAALLGGCAEKEPPVRSGEFSGAGAEVRAYHDYLALERAGAESVHIVNLHEDEVVSLPFYLFMVARAFERRGRFQDAAKLYFRMLLSYSLLEDEGQLGVRVENRLRWILGDKSWALATPEELAKRLVLALARRDRDGLERLISRDFGFGRSEDDRYAVDYHEALQILEESLADSPEVALDTLVQTEPERWVLRTTGWIGEHRVWYFNLRRSPVLGAWEWTLAAWGEPGE